MTDTVREFNIGHFKGDLPNVPIAEGVDMEAIKETDNDPFFVTLPIVPEIGAVSNNGLLYDEALVNAVQEQINSKRPGGIFGHLKDADRNHSFPIPEGTWVGATRQNDTLWGKAYIPPGAARDYIRRLRAVGGSIATSIYGKGQFKQVRDGVRRLEGFVLESLDFAPPERAALGYGAVPMVTAEMETEQEPIMADKAQVIAELTVADIPAPLRDAIVAEATRQDETLTTIAELTSTVAAKDEVISELNQQIETYRRAGVEAAVDSRVAELTDWQVRDDEGKAKLAKLRNLLRGQIMTRLGDNLQTERVAEIAEDAWTDLQPLAEMIRDALAGPAAIVKGKVAELTSNGVAKLEDTPEARERELSRMGIAV